MALNFEETLDLFLSSKDVGPHERKQLSGLLKHYAKKAHPFRACVTPDSPVDAPRDMEIYPDGIPISQLRVGDLVWSYNKKNRAFELKPVVWAKETRKDAELLEIKLDSGKTIRCTPEHRFMLRDGKWLEAKQLRSGDSLMPLYRDFTPRIRLKPDKLGYENEHKVIGRSIGDVAGKHIHHIDERRANTSVDNIAIVSGSEHIESHHSQFSEVIESNKEQWCCLDCSSLYTPIYRNQKRCQECQSEKSTYQKVTVGKEKQCRLCNSKFIVVQPNQKFCAAKCRNTFHDNKSKTNRTIRAEERKALGLPARKPYGERICVGCGVEFSMRANNQKYCNVECREFAKKNPLTEQSAVWNHKVRSIKSLSETSDVWDIEVEDNHNFIVNGVVLHNCVRDNRKRFGPGTEAVCATLKDIIRGTTHWRGHKSMDKGAKGLTNLSDQNQPIDKTVNKLSNSEDNNSDMLEDPNVQDVLNKLSDDELEQLIDLARQAQEENDVEDTDIVLDTPPEEANYGDGSGDMKCGSCSHYADGLCAQWVSHVDPNSTCDQFNADGEDQPVSSLALSELYFAEAPEAQKDKDKKGVWKKVLKTGTWAMSPSSFGPIQKPMKVVRGEGKSDHSKNIMSLDDIVKTFKSKAVENVTVPLEHVKDPEKNTGFVEEVEIEKGEDGNDYLKALINFTEPEVENKVLNGSIRNTSVGIKFGYPDKENGRIYPIALDHVALTNKPFLKGIPAFSFSEQESKDIPIFIYSEENGDKEMEKEKETLLSELEAEKAKALAEEKKQIELSEENAALKRQIRQGSVEKRIKELADGGLADHPGLLKKVTEIMLSDSGEKIIELSEEGQTRSITATEIVEDLLKVMPQKDLLLGEQHEDVGAEKPPVDASKEKSKEERLEDTQNFLAGKQ